jgi:hypothetical protein
MLLTVLRWSITHIHTFIHNDKYAKPVIGVLGVVLAVFIGMMAYRHFQPTYTETVFVKGPETIKTVTVDRPVLTEKIVTKVLSDPKDKAAIAALMAENAKLKLDVTALTQTIAELKQSGGGAIVKVEPPKDNPTGPVSYEYKDWHLKFNTDLKTAHYDLTQKFEVLTTTAKNKDGTQAAMTALYELGANGERIPATNTKVTGIFTDATTPHWLVKLNIQGGVGFTRDKVGVSANGGIAAVQWLKHGRTKATEDVTFAVASPAFFFGSSVQDIGILPISFNLGRLPHQPLTNLWVSPFISKAQRLGVTLTATF